MSCIMDGEKRRETKSLLDDGMEKRVVKLTAKALANKIETLQTERKSCVKRHKRLAEEIKGLMESDVNARDVQCKLDLMLQLFENAKVCHDSVIILIPKAEQDIQNEWFDRITKNNNEFKDDVEIWLGEIKKSPRSERMEDDHGANQPGAVQTATAFTLKEPAVVAPMSAQSQETNPHDNLQQTDLTSKPNTTHEQLEETDSHNGDAQHDNAMATQSNMEPENELLNQMMDQITPQDSASNCGRRSRGSSGSGSRVSSTASARILAEAEVAALKVQQQTLKNKHALEEQEEQLRKKKEQIEMEGTLAAAVAKMDVLALKGSSVHGKSSRASKRSDAMNSYFERNQNKNPAQSPVRPTGLRLPSQIPSATVNVHVSGSHDTNQTLHGPTVGHNPPGQSVISPPPMISALDGAGTSGPAVVAAPLTHQLNSGYANKDGTVSSSVAQPASNNAQQSNVYTVMEKQNEITALLLQQQCLSSMPKREIDVFDGDPLKYQTFIKSFEHNIESKNANPKDCLYYLEQYTRGLPRELVRSCLYMPTDTGFLKAKFLVEKNFGNQHTIATAYMEKVLAWQSIRSDDTKALQAYTLFLRGCCNTMDEVSYLQELNMTANMMAIIRKLPYRLRDKWRTVACDYQERYNSRATFKNLVDFLERQVRIATDPVYGDIKDAPSVSRDLKRPKSQPQLKRGSAFATTVAVIEKTPYKGTNGKECSSAVSKCLSCGGGHALDVCLQFEKRTHNEKIAFLKENGICFGCLCKGHISKDCRKRLSCTICSLRHPKMLHIHQLKKRDTDKERTEPTKTVDGATPVEGNAATSVTTVQSSGLTGAGEDSCKLSIVPVQVKAKKGSITVHTFAFLDPGSTASFCTVGLMEKLKVQGRKSNITLSTLGQRRVVETSIVRGLEIAGLDRNNFCDLPGLYTQQTLPVHKGNITRQCDIEQWPHLSSVHLPEVDLEIELLIGLDVPKALEPLNVIRSTGDGPYAVETMLGWTVNGPLGGKCDDTQEKAVNRISVVKLDEIWEHQFKTDFPECSRDDHELSREDEQFLELVTKSSKLVNNHYSIGLPLRTSQILMPDNKSVAEQRTLNLRRRFKKDAAFHSDYTTFMSDMISKGYAEKVPEDVLERNDGKKWYLPHHGVVHPQKKKLRVVFDCGATFKGVSLNSHLLQGPDLTNTLIGVLARFRKESVVIAADIEAMFHQVKVPSEDRDMLRFLWWPDGNCDQNMIEYRMAVHLFGATSSPSCSNFALRRCAEDNMKEFSSQATDVILNNFYVDDCLASVATEEEAIALYHELRAICLKGGFLLNKWISNSRRVLAVIPEVDRAKEVMNLDLDKDILPVERVLGVHWCIQSDTFGFRINLKHQPCTRRGILSTVSSIYDPLGMVAPVVLTAKKILQDLCREKIGWDDEVPHNIIQEWMSWIQNLHQLEDFKLDRCFKPINFGPMKAAQLHHFADACEDGYGTVSYLLLHNNRDEAHCAFVMGKARVAPLKPATIPRMELTAATMASRMDTLLRKELQIDLADSIFWTDSTSVLKYINNKTSRFRTFVANRVSQIAKVSHAQQWRYVNSASNPADMASRGLDVRAFLKKKIWPNGPPFLQRPQEEWPQNPDRLEEISPKDCELKCIHGNAAQITEGMDATTRLIHHFSSWTRLKRAAAWMLRLKAWLLHQSRKKSQASNHETQKTSGLEVEELAQAEMAIIRYCQSTRFTDEILCLEKGMNVKRKSHIHNLKPILDKDLLRVGGRLSRAASMSEEEKHPVILAKDFHISNLILRHVHQETGHGGRNYMLSRLRQRYWIPGATVSIRKIISKCVVCRRMNTTPAQQLMADLPVDRVSPDQPPFTYVGVNYFGPFGVKRGRSVVKRYGVIFTCLTLRAIHLEVASSLDTDSFINALRRFTARRGQVKELRSDNGTNFVGAQRELKEAIEGWNQEQIHNTLLQKGIRWNFHPPAGSHHGGVWERMIRSVRKVLNSTLNLQSLDEEGLQTVFCEAEAILNGRPITKASTDPDDLEALTPNHLLLLKAIPSLPPGIFQKTDLYSRRRWRQIQYMSDVFWKRWLREYLPQLQERQKWSQTRRNFTPGDIVMIVDDSAPRNSWPIAKVVETIADSKGLVRMLRLKTKFGFLNRPISKVCLLQETEEL